MFPAIVPNHPAPVNPPPRPLTVDEYLAALAAINASFTADCATLKARYPGKRSKWPPEALKEADAIQARFDEAIDHLFESCERGEEVAL